MKILELVNYSNGFLVNRLNLLTSRLLVLMVLFKGKFRPFNKPLESDCPFLLTVDIVLGLG